MPNIIKSVLIFLILPALFAGSAMAQEQLPEPEKPVVLTLLNTITDNKIELTEDDLLAFDQVTIRTENEFVDGMGEFSGPLARDVLAWFSENLDESDENGDAVVPDDRIFIFTAVNEYAVQIPAEDFVKYDVIFAMYQDGERLSLRTKGPIWVIYPMSDHSVLQDRTYNDRLIWQLALVSIE